MSRSKAIQERFAQQDSVGQILDSTANNCLIRLSTCKVNYNWRGERKTMLSDDFNCFSFFFFFQSAWNFACCFQLNRKTSPCIFPLVYSSFSRYYVCKNLSLLSRQHVTVKTVISLKIPQNIDPLQRATLKKCWFQVKTVKDFTQISLKLQANVNFTQCTSLDNVDFRSFTGSWNFDFTLSRCPRTLISLREPWKVHFTQHVSSIERPRARMSTRFFAKIDWKWPKQLQTSHANLFIPVENCLALIYPRFCCVFQK